MSEEMMLHAVILQLLQLAITMKALALLSHDKVERQKIYTLTCKGDTLAAFGVWLHLKISWHF
jgi:hypothetical protein